MTNAFYQVGTAPPSTVTSESDYTDANKTLDDFLDQGKEWKNLINNELDNYRILKHYYGYETDNKTDSDIETLLNDRYEGEEYMDGTGVSFRSSRSF